MPLLRPLQSRSNQRRWNAKPVSEEEKKKFSEARKRSGIKIMFSHCSYLLNLGTLNSEIYQKTISALTDEVIRCTGLRLKFCVLHPGSAGEQTKEQAMRRIGRGLKTVLKNTSSSNVMIALENTAGQGKIGLNAFRYIMKNFPDIPKVLETPKEDNWDQKNLEALRSLV